MGVTLPTIGMLNWGDDVNNVLEDFQDSAVVANDGGFLSWNYSPQHISVASGAVVSGTVKMVRLPRFTQAKSVSSVWFCLTAAAVTPTAGQCFAAIYNSAGTRIGVTADISAQLTASGGTLVGWALTAAAACPVGDYYAALLQNAGTPATLGVSSAAGYTDAVNLGLTAATALHTDGPTAQTSMPASVTMASRTRSSQAIWAGVK